LVQMAPQAWGFDVNNAVDFQGTLPDAPAWLGDVEKLLLQENYDQAAQAAEQNLADARRSDDRLAQSFALHALARVKCTRNAYSEARIAAEEALESFRAADSAKGVASTTLLLAKIALDMREASEAERLATEALSKFQAASSRTGEAAVHHMLARMHIRDSRVDEALEEIEQARALFEKSGDKEGQAAALLVKGNIYAWNYSDGQEEALKVGREAVALCRKVGRPACRLREADAQFLVATAAFTLKRHKDGLKAAKESLELFKEWGGPRSQASSMRAVAMGLMQCDRLEEAHEVAEQTLSMLRAQGTTDETLLAEALAVDAMIARQRFAKGEPDEDGSMVQKARDVLEAFVKLDEDYACAMHRLELGQALQLSGDSAAALTEVTIALEFFTENKVKASQGLAMMTLAMCQLGTGDPKAALDTAAKAEKFIEDPTTLSELAEFMGVVKSQARGGGGPKWGSQSGSWSNYDDPKAPNYIYKAEEGGVKRSVYSDLVNMRIHSGDTPEPISFDTAGIFYMDQFLGVSMPFMPTKRPPIPGVYPDGLDTSKMAPAPAPKPQQPKPAAAPAGGGVVSVLSTPSRPPATAKPAGPIVIKPAILGNNDALGGRYRDCPEDIHDRMVALARAGALPTTTLSQRQVLERKKSTFHGHAEWREAARWGYIHPTVAAPKGCKWYKVSIGHKLVGPSPGELLGTSNEDAALSARPASRFAWKEKAAGGRQPGGLALEKLLRGANPDWTAGDVAVARRKLEAVSIDSAASLVEALSNIDAEDLNLRLQRAGEQALEPQTLQALRAYAASLANSEPWLGPAAAQFAVQEHLQTRVALAVR